MSVWVVQTGDYEQRGICLIAASLEVAVKAIKERYPAPYKVTWEELVQQGSDYELKGHFEQVPHYAIERTAYFDIEEMEVVCE